MNSNKYIEIPRVVVPGWAVAIIIGIVLNFIAVAFSYGSIMKQVELMQQSQYRLEDRVNALSVKGGK